MAKTQSPRASGTRIVDTVKVQGDWTLFIQPSWSTEQRKSILLLQRKGVFFGLDYSSWLLTKFNQIITQAFILLLLLFLASPTLAKVLGLGHEILALGETVNSQAQLIILQVRKLSRLLCPWDCPGRHTGVGCRFLLQGFFLTQGSSPYPHCLLYCRWIICHWTTGEAP